MSSPQAFKDSEYPPASNRLIAALISLSRKLSQCGQFQFHMLNNETGFKSVHSAQSVVGLHQPLSPGSMTLQGLLFS